MKLLASQIMIILIFSVTDYQQTYFTSTRICVVKIIINLKNYCSIVDLLGCVNFCCTAK